MKLNIIRRFCLVLMFIAVNASAQRTQKIDSLVARLDIVKDVKDKVNTLSLLTEINSNYSPTAGISYGEKALASMSGSDWNLQKAKVLRYLGICHKNKGDFVQALNYLYQSLHISQQGSMADQVALTKRQIGLTYKQQRNRAQAESFFQDALAYFETVNSNVQQTIVLIDLGGLCADHGDIEGAKSHYERALSLASKGTSATRKALVISNLAGIYGAEGNYKKALGFYENALNLAKSQNDVREEMFIYGQMGFEYLNYLTDKENVAAANKPDGTRESHIAKAIEYIEKAADYFKKTEQVNDYQAFMRALPEAYFLARQYEKGIDAFKTYYESKENTAEKQRIADLARAQLDYEFNRRKDSTQTAQEKKELQLHSEMRVREINFAYQKRQQADQAEKERMELQFSETLKRKNLESQHARSREQIKQESQRKLRMAWTIAGSVATLLLIFYLIRTAQFARRKVAMEKSFSQNLVQTVESERKRIAEELHDSVGQSLLVLKNKLYHDKTDTQTVDDIIGEVRGLSHNMHPYQFERQGLIKSVENAVHALQQHSDIFFSFDCGDETLGDRIKKENQIHIYRMIQESLNNVVKHSGAKGCRVSADDKGDWIVFEVKDNGRGFDVKSAGFESLGLKTMESRAKLTGSTMEYKSAFGKGTSVVIKTPKV